MQVLTLKGLSKRYGQTTVVDGIDLELRAGEFVSLLGPSGCGKTTTLRMVAGFVEPSSGTIAIDGRVLSSPDHVVPPEQRRMSMIFQSYAIWPNMTVFENVAFGLKVRRVSREETRTRVGEMLDVVRLGHLAGRYPNELSGGQQQRVALARAVVVKPDVLLLDEPLSNLDANLREEMRTEIRRLHDAFAITTIYVTHDQAEAMATADRIAVMSEGRIEQVDDPVTIYTRPRTRFVAGFIGRTNFLAGRLNGSEVEFDGFQVASARMTPCPSGETFSLRPGAIELRRGAADDRDLVSLPGTVRSRTYLGDMWDLTVEVGSRPTQLRVSAPPDSVFETGERAYVVFDPSRITPIA